jgi:hypothetical protein
MDTSILREWLGAGGVPVKHETAAIRAFICEYCPENVAAKWWEFAKDPIAAVIRQHLQLKHEMKIFVPNEEALNMCRRCGCCIRLKVHVPIEHIKNHITPEQLAEYARACWIKNVIRKSKT